MFVLMLAAAAATAAPVPPRDRTHRRDAHSVMQSQLASPPRAGATGGVSAEEADVIMQHYLASIGKRLDPIVTTVGAPQ
jgi:hypothetical protein